MKYFRYNYFSQVCRDDISDIHTIGTATKFFFSFLKANQKHWKAHFNTEETNLNEYEQMYNRVLWTLHETYSPKSSVLIGLTCHLHNQNRQ